MKKLKHEKELLKEAVRIGTIYAQSRGAVKFDVGDSNKDKAVYIYQLLVHDKVIQPLAKGQEDSANMQHKLAHWVLKNLAEDHPLKQQ